jgi:hypothetical protein
LEPVALLILLAVTPLCQLLLLRQVVTALKALMVDLVDLVAVLAV